MFNRLLLTAALFCVVIPAAQTQESTDTPPANPQVIIHTNKGKIQLELFADKAPKTVENFLQYARDGFYDETIFHRVISNFMIQGGGFTVKMEKKETREPIENEAFNNLQNLKGTIAMARTNHPHSATAQFFINVQDNFPLDHSGKDNSRAWGYAVFGQVTEGMDVVEEIRYVETGPRPGYQDVPKEPVIIEQVEILD